MTLFFVPKVIRDIIQTATQAAEKAKDANYIRTTPRDRTHLILTTHVNGSDAAWIEYNKTQLQELIRMLQAHEEDMA